jgi:hypothetical protein
MNRRKTILTTMAATAFTVAGVGGAMAGVTPSQTITVAVDAKAQTTAPLDTGVVVNSQSVN